MSELSKAALGCWLMVLGITTVGMTQVEFPWEALATFVAGTAAVIGAVSVGKRQTSIATAQNAILARQTELQGLGLRKELFEKRFAVFETTSEFMRLTYNGEVKTGSDIALEFKKARDQARFLFDQELSQTLDEIHTRCWSYTVYNNLNIQRVEHGIEVPQDAIDRVSEQQGAIGMDHANLYHLFGPHLSVSDKPFIPRKISETPNGEMIEEAL